MADGLDLSEDLRESLETQPGIDGLGQAIALVGFLRRHCPWDGKQTHESLIPHLLEEAYEVANAIRDGNLITGQQQNSGAAAAELVLEALSETH